MKKLKKIILKILLIIAFIILICESNINAFTIILKVISLLYIGIYCEANK